METHYQSLLRGLTLERFDIGTAAEAAEVPVGRVAQWIKVGAVDLVDSSRPGTGRSRLFHLFDVYSLRLFGALTDPMRGLGLPLKVAKEILLTAWGLGDTSFTGPALQRHELGVFERRRRAYLDGTFAAGWAFERDPKNPQWLVGSLLHYLEPDVSFWRGHFAKHPAHDGTNPQGKPLAFIALEATPHLIEVDKILFAKLGLPHPFATVGNAD
ncbi:MAG: hypothetical protein DI601_08105 [Azospirillum brasilense]|nr:MAG: hypothetical protein DI601_08105 [Azospirillum brasilense]